MSKGPEDNATAEYENKLLAKVVLPEGTRVRRGRDWMWGNQDGPTGSDREKVVGTVIARYRDLAVIVEWDLNNWTNYWYRWGDGNAFDLLPLDPTQLDVSALTEDEQVYILGYGLLTYPEMGELLKKAVRKLVRFTPLAPQPIEEYRITADYNEPVDLSTLPLSISTVEELRRQIAENVKKITGAFVFDSGAFVFDSPPLRVPAVPPSGEWRLPEWISIDFSINPTTPPKEPTEGERLAAFFARSEHEGHPQVRYVRPPSAVSRMHLPSALAPAHVRRDFCDTRDAILCEEDLAEDGPLALRDDFDNLPDAD